MTGRGLGYCAGYDSPGYTKGVPRGGAGYGRGMGYGHGRGWGRGFGRRSYPAYPVQAPVATYSKEDELRLLKDQADQMKTDMETINKRIEELGKE
jgi:hypothetical protein